jgi:hypothetical protein
MTAIEHRFPKVSSEDASGGEVSNTAVSTSCCLVKQTLPPTAEFALAYVA